MSAASAGAPGARTSWPARILLAAGGLLFSLLLAEGGIRLYEALVGPLGARMRTSGNEVKRHHDLLDYEYIPGARSARVRWPEHPNGFIEVGVNNLGLRMDRDVTREKPAGTLRILTLGDSQTAGIVDNPESWPNLLDARLAAAAGRPVEVLNAGVTGYRPMQEYLWWRVNGRGLHPDYVILGYYTGNDFFDAARGRLKRGAGGAWTLDETPWPDSGPGPWERALLHTRLWSILIAPLRPKPFEGFDRRPDAFDDPAFRARYEPLYLNARRECVGCFSQSFLQAHILLVGDPDELDADRDATRELLARLRNETAEAGAGLLLVLIPGKLQIEEDGSGRAAKLAAEMGLPPPSQPIEDRVRAEMTQIAAGLGVEMLDPLDALKAARAAAPKPFYYDEDWHLNVDGNEALARIVQERLVSGPLAAAPPH